MDGANWDRRAERDKSARLLTITKHRMVLITLPCGLPLSKQNGWERVFATRTYIFLSNRKSLIHAYILPCILSWFNFILKTSLQKAYREISENPQTPKDDIDNSGKPAEVSFK